MLVTRGVSLTQAMAMSPFQVSCLGISVFGILILLPMIPITFDDA